MTGRIEDTAYVERVERERDQLRAELLWAAERLDAVTRQRDKLYGERERARDEREREASERMIAIRLWGAALASLQRVELERDALRAELAPLRAELQRLRAELQGDGERPADNGGGEYPRRLEAVEAMRRAIRDAMDRAWWAAEDRAPIVADVIDWYDDQAIGPMLDTLTRALSPAALRELDRAVVVAWGA
jgi:chromosome segregation ATPase